MNIIKSIISFMGYVFLAFFSFFVISWLIIIILAMVNDPYCLKHGRHIPDEEFARAVIPPVQADYARDTEKIRKELEESSLPSDAESILKWRKSGGNFYADWDGQLPDFNGSACCKVYREPTERFFIYRLIGVQDVVVSIGPKGKGGVLFYFDVCGNQWHSHIGIHGISVESTK